MKLYALLIQVLEEKILLWDVKTLNWGLSGREGQYYLRAGMVMCHEQLSYIWQSLNKEWLRV